MGEWEGEFYTSPSFSNFTFISLSYNQFLTISFLINPNFNSLFHEGFGGPGKTKSTTHLIKNGVFIFSLLSNGSADPPEAAGRRIIMCFRGDFGLLYFVFLLVLGGQSSGEERKNENPVFDGAEVGWIWSFQVPQNPVGEGDCVGWMRKMTSGLREKMCGWIT